MQRFGPAAIAAIVMLLFTVGMLIAGNSADPSQLGVPVEKQMGYQASATTIMDRVNSLTYLYHWIAALITLFVTALLVYVCWRFSEKNNPEPSQFTHNTLVEVVWTVVPVLVLVGMAVPSLKLLYAQETVPPADVTVKAIGNQWNWTYVYDIDGEEYSIDSLMAGYGYASYDEMVAGMKAEGEPDEAIPSRENWKLKATAPMVVPVNSIVRVQVTASDVLHAWAVPSFGVKVDAVPGRLNQTWFNARTEGTYFGQCSELCGRDHSYMPIEVKVVSQKEYNASLVAIKQAALGVPEHIKVALNAPVFTAE